MYFVLLGDPFKDSVPALTIWNNWKIDTRTRLEDNKEVKRDWLSGGNFLACGSGGDGSYSIYSGPSVIGRCTDFAMEVVWDDKDPITATTTTKPVETTTTCDSTTATQEPTTTTTTTDCSTTTDVPVATELPVTTVSAGPPTPTNGTIPISAGPPTPTNGTISITTPTLKPTESPAYDGAAVHNAKAGSLVVAIAVAVAFFGL